LPIGHLVVDVASVGLLSGPAVTALVDAGNLPASILVDSGWFPVHECISLVIWFLIGLGIDSRRFPLRTEMFAFLGLRAVLVAAVRVAYPLWHAAVSLQTLVWIALAVWGAGWCLTRAAKQIRALVGWDVR
jgi:hypothetical protein